MAFYGSDFVGDTLHLSAAETGAYVLLMVAMWNAGGALPDNAVKLARIARCAPGQWPRVWASVSEFFTVEDGIVTQKRLAYELHVATNLIATRRHSGKLGGEAKALKTQEAALAGATLGHKQKPAIQNQNQNQQKEEKKKKDDVPGASALVSDFDRFWAVYPKRVGQNPKHPASLKFLRAVKQGADPEAIIASARRYAIECSGIEDRTFVTQAVTWLNQRRWEDGPGLLPEGAEMPKTTGPPAPGLPTEEELREKYRKIKANGNGHDAENTTRDLRGQGHGVHSGAEGIGYGPGDGDPSRH